MKVERRDGKRERQILTALVVDPGVLGKVSTKWTDDGLFSSTWSNLIARWCVEYHRRYNKAPGKQIEGLFQSWAEDAQSDKDTIRIVEKFLGELSGEYSRLKKEVNSEYVTDLAGDYFNRVRLTRLTEAIQGDLDTGKAAKALARVETFGRIEMGVGSYVDLFTDEHAVRETFTQNREPLITYPGDLGKFYGDQLEREGFISFLAPEKRGKSFHLLDMAYRAVSQRRRVAFFEVGDLSVRQIKRRFMSRVSGRPMKARTEENPVIWPKELVMGDGGRPVIVPEYKVFPKALSETEAWEACKRFMKGKVRSEQSYFRMSNHPNSSVSVAGVRQILRQWESDGFTPDCVFVDYSDILAPAPGHKESRDAVNDTWKQLRRMSQELHCLVVTATQANASSYKSEGLDMSHFSEDKRKFAHVTGMVGINQADQDRKEGIQSLNWLVLREDEFFTDRYCYVAKCLPLANPCVRSLMPG